MKTPQCVITGCALLVNGIWAAGDLFDAGDCYIFNANVSVGGPHRVETMWHAMDTCHYMRRLEPTDWFEKRGVYVIMKSVANLNAAAKDYIGEKTPWSATT